MRVSLLIVIFATALLNGTIARAQDGVRFEEVACDEVIPFLVVTDDMYCGYLVVPEDHTSLDSPEIEIAVVILEAFNDDPRPDAIIYLEGGPGGSGIYTIDSWLDHPLRQDRDIVLFDQRGTGFSYPFLGCWEVFDAELEIEDSGLDVEDAYELQAQALAACRERLEEEGVNLSNYNSVQSAADVDALRAVLGYDSVNLIGVSYGTRLALAVMHYYPDAVRSVIIDSVYPPQVNAYEEQATNIADSIVALLQACEDDMDCAVSYPDLEQVFYDLIDALNENPASFEVEDADGAIYDELIYGDDLVSNLANYLYSHNIIPYLPRMIYEVSEGNYETLAALVSGTIGAAEESDSPFIDWKLYDEYSDLSDSNGLFYSVECAEEIPFNSIDISYTSIEPYPDQLENALIGDAEQLYDDCEVWDVQAADLMESEAVVSDIPTLLLVGQFDPVTPPAWGFGAAEFLSNGYAYEFPGLGHGIIDGGDCPEAIIETFLDNPEFEPDSSCIGSLYVTFQ